MNVTAGAALTAMRGFPIVQPAPFIGRGLVVVAPHPDDESLGCGGLIAACRAQNIAVGIVIVSDGAGSHPNSRDFPPPRLVALRRAEALAAAALLGVSASNVHFLDLPDQAVPDRGAEAELAIRTICRVAAAAATVAVTWHHDPHCDHHASFVLAHAATARLPGVRLWEYPVWGLTLPADAVLEGAIPRGVRVDVGAHLEAKRAAIHAHASQCSTLIEDDPHGFRLQAPMLALFAGRYEIFIETTP